MPEHGANRSKTPPISSKFEYFGKLFSLEVTESHLHLISLPVYWQRVYKFICAQTPFIISVFQVSHIEFGNNFRNYEQEGWMLLV